MQGITGTFDDVVWLGEEMMANDTDHGRLTFSTLLGYLYHDSRSCRETIHYSTRLD